MRGCGGGVCGGCRPSAWSAAHVESLGRCISTHVPRLLDNPLVVDSFASEVTTQRSAKDIVRASLGSLAEPLSNWDYRLTTQSEVAVTYERTYRPWYTWLFGILFLPILIGFVILLFATETSRIMILIEERESDTRVLIKGNAPRQVRQAFQDLQF